MFGRRSQLTSKRNEEDRRTLTSPLRVKPTPELRLSFRAVLCLTSPLIVGVIIAQREYSIIFAIGSLWAISQDGLDEWRVRGPRLLWVGVAGGIGVLLGATFVNHEAASWTLIVLYGAVAFLAGYIEASNRATAGAYLLVGTILGGGLRFPGKIWQSALALALGSLWVFLVAFLMNRRGRWSVQRLTLARAFNELAGVADAIGTPQFSSVRDRAVSALDRANDVVGMRPLRADNREALALQRCLVVALRIGEVISFLEIKGASVDPAMASGLRDIATILNESNATSAVAALENFPHRFESPSGLHPSVLTALEPVSLEELEAHPLRPLTRAATRSSLAVRERLRFALILAVAVAAGTAISVTLNDPHGFWLPMSVALILRPDVGPVISRALARTVGTVVGVGIAGIVALTGNAILALILLSCVMAAIQPWAARRSHTLAIMVFTPLVFVFLGLLGSDRGLFAARIIDTALAAGVVLILDVCVWTTAPSMRPAQQLQQARAAAARYEDDATLDDPITRTRLRRAALRAVVRARASLSQNRTEPRLLERHDPTIAAQLDNVERSIDEHTASLLEQHS
ncbi:MAG TPA: FUSC family protein [Acidimicrobiales bacterium]